MVKDDTSAQCAGATLPAPELGILLFTYSQKARIIKAYCLKQEIPS